MIIACSHFLRLFPWICPPQAVLFIFDDQYLGGGSLSPAGSGDHQAFCGLFQFDRQVNTAQCLPAIQPALLRWRRRQNAEHCEKNYTYTCNQSACGAKQYQESYFMSYLELDHLLASWLYIGYFSIFLVEENSDYRYLDQTQAVGFLKILNLILLLTT